MLDAPIPADDELRLADLCALEVLDTAPERRFDRITEAARRHFNVPIALVSLVDRDRQWFKSRSGLEATETPRNISFCGHAIHHDYPFIVTNAATDSRFADNPLVTGDLHLRFYAGHPLKSRHGRRLGTLCLIDHAPRSFTADDLVWLADLAAWAERELNLRELEDANEVAERSARRLQVVLDSTTDAIIAVDEQLKVHTFNRAAEQMFGFKSEAMVDGTVRRVLPNAVIDQLDEAFGTLLVHHQLHLKLPAELTLLSGDGTPFLADIRIGRTEIKGLACFTLIIRDVTDQREVEAMKCEFVATVSHELRTPITSIKGAVQLALSMGDLPASQRRLLDIAEKNCMRLSQMVNDILDLEKLDTGKLQMDCTVQSILPWLRNALLTMQPYADQFGVALSLESPLDDAGACSSFDENRITQVVVNLLSNAIKFSPEGSQVRIAVSVTGQRLRIAVADQGKGIPEEFRSRIFQRFAQASPGQVRGQASSGLGLAICRSIIEQHGGQISFDSVLGGGSTFYVDLPLGVPLVSR